MGFLSIARLLRVFLNRYPGGIAMLYAMHRAYGYRFVGKELVCPHGGGHTVVIRQYVGGKLVGELRIKTCYRCDLGL